MSTQIKFSVHNNGPNKSTGTRVTFSGLENVTLTNSAVTKGTWESGIWIIGELGVGEQVDFSADAEIIFGPTTTVTARVCSSVSDTNLNNNIHEFDIEKGGGEEPVEGCPFSTTMDSDFGMQFGIETSHSLDGMVFAYGGYNHGTITTDVPQDLVGMQMSFDGSTLSVSLETPDLGYGDDDIKVTLSIPGLIPYTVYLRKSPEPTEYFYLGDLYFDNGTETDFMVVGMCVSIIVSPAVEA